MSAKLLKDTFRAWIDRIPGCSPKLIVTGAVEGTSIERPVSLRRAEPQDVNPAILVLELVARQLAGPVRSERLVLTVEYEEAPVQGSYRRAVIRNGADSVTVEARSAY